MMRSLPVLADTLASFSRDWTFTLYVVLLPKYFSDMFSMPVASGSSLSTLPHVATAVVMPLAGRLADLILEKDLLAITNLRKLFTVAGFGGEVVMFLVLIFTRDFWVVSAIGLTVACGISTLSESGYKVNKLTMAPRYAGVLEGVTNGIGNIAGILSLIHI